MKSRQGQGRSSSRKQTPPSGPCTLTWMPDGVIHSSSLQASFPPSSLYCPDPAETEGMPRSVEFCFSSDNPSDDPGLARLTGKERLEESVVTCIRGLPCELQADISALGTRTRRGSTPRFLGYLKNFCFIFPFYELGFLFLGRLSLSVHGSYDSLRAIHMATVYSVRCILILTGHLYDPFEVSQSRLPALTECTLVYAPDF